MTLTALQDLPNRAWMQCCAGISSSQLWLTLIFILRAGQCHVRIWKSAVLGIFTPPELATTTSQNSFFLFFFSWRAVKYLPTFHWLDGILKLFS